MPRPGFPLLGGTGGLVPQKGPQLPPSSGQGTERGRPREQGLTSSCPGMSMPALCRQVQVSGAEETKSGEREGRPATNQGQGEAQN